MLSYLQLKTRLEFANRLRDHILTFINLRVLYFYSICEFNLKRIYNIILYDFKLIL